MPVYLVIQLARFGDILQSGRLIRTLLERGETHVCVDHSLAGMAALVYPQAHIHAVHAHASGADALADILHANWRAFAALSDLSFTDVYNLNRSGMNEALARLFEYTTVHGYASFNGQILRSRWLDFAFRWTQHRRSAPLNLVDVWAGLVANPLAPEACTPKPVGQGRGLGIVLAGRESRRSLPPEILAPCVHALFEKLDGPAVWLFGSAAERPLARKLMDSLPGKVLEHTHNLAGKTTLPDLFEAVQGLDLVFTPDTGIMHLAACVGAPVQAVFLSSAWAWETGPYGIGHTVWQTAAACAPCLEAAACYNDMLCLDVFSKPAFLNTLTGRHALPETSGLWQLKSGADALGLTWTQYGGDDDPAARRRLEQRALLMEYAQVEYTRAEHTQQMSGAAISSAVAQTFYHEADWMLPDPLP